MFVYQRVNVRGIGMEIWGVAGILLDSYAGTIPTFPMFSTKCLRAYCSDWVATKKGYIVWRCSQSPKGISQDFTHQIGDKQ